VNPDWYDTDYIGIDQGPIIIMIENYRTGAVWNRFMQNDDIQRGLERAGFNPVVGVGEGPGGNRPGIVLSQNAPNPARDATMISFTVEQDGPATLVLFDVEGRALRTLYDGAASRGDHVVRLDTRSLPAGVYFYRLTGTHRSSGRSLVIAR
jgi:hypothetical protein